MSRGRAIAVASALVAVAALLGTALWLTTPRSDPFYTDADTIRASEELAVLRDVLWQPPERFEGPLNTLDDDEYEATISPDGLTMVFVRGKAGGGADLYSSTRTPEGWTEPAPVEAINTEADELGPAFAHDGSGLYFYSDREGSLGGYDIWFVPSVNSAWGTPIHLGPGVNSPFNDYGPAPMPDGTKLYFASNRPRAGEPIPENPPASWPATIRESFMNRPYDLYSAPIGERGYGEASIVEELSSPLSEGSPSVSPVGDFIYFASDRPGGAGGFDLYRSRIVDDTYFPVEHLGDGVNTEANELDPALGMGGFGLAFSSDRDAGAGRRYDLYRTHSREVFRDVETLAARMTWPELLRIVVPWLLLALLLLGLLAVLRRLAMDDRWKARWRRLGLMAKCLLVSGLVHMLILALLTLWQVSAHLEGLLGSPGGSKVTLVSQAVGGGIESQILAEVTPMTMSRPVEMALVPAPVLEMRAAEVTPTLLAAPTSSPTIDTLAQQPVELRSLAPATEIQPRPLESLPEAASDTAVALPEHRSRSQAMEAEVSSQTAALDTPSSLPSEAVAITGPQLAPASLSAPEAMRVRDELPSVAIGVSERSAIPAQPSETLKTETEFARESFEPSIPEVIVGAERAATSEAEIGSAKYEDALQSVTPQGVELASPAPTIEASTLESVGAIEIEDTQPSASSFLPRQRSVRSEQAEAVPLDPGLFELDIALPEGMTLPEQVALPRYFSGIVLDDATGQPVESALIRIDSDRGDLVETRTATDGTFALEPRFEAEFVAVTASKPGYTPAAMNLPIEELERGAVREIRLEPVRDTVIALEAEPQVHHLGDNDFGGQINSQFQRESEGLVLSAEFTLTAEQGAALVDRAGVTMLAKGLQADNIVRINGHDVPRRLSRSPSDGSFGEVLVVFDASWLREGANRIEIESVVSAGRDHDDFEVVNIRILLAPPAEPERPRRRRASNTL